jgi:hypothetical protein
MIFQDDGSIALRQSWLDTAMRCPEEGRLAVVKPEFETVSSDEAIIGTGAHYAIEQLIRGAITADEIGRTAYEYTVKLIGDEGCRWTKRSSAAECGDLAARCAEAWVEDIMPVAPIEGAKTEVTFSVPLMMHRDRQILLQGTVDLVPQAHELWDWKTAASDYKQKDKQKWAIQPTIYAMAAVRGGLQSTVKYSYPLDFHYGVMIKRANKCRGQILTVRRTMSHERWAIHRIRTLLDLALDFGLDKPWPQIDASNYLCSARWCSFYSICRGTEITEADDYWSPDE